ncbi:PREDICTED: uncharacterized protein LOC106117924 [Papilio xuthus]|uniref:Uncharacterized protein LOC106117924 n=1 Tax=Papilio xuthus TaxID=66420 RepID=A0A194Q1W2_PAPXU|nr:PREDICTED: uncharacterized protein LOC106117924 [Papilio xuthus]KPI98984.1 hypothetical protein RR46_10302 [Papilio xuthus]
MSLKAYEDACTRAELFGQPLPDREEFLEKHKYMDVVEFEEVDIRTAENSAMLDDDIKHASSGLAELNTILSSTQTKLNRLKGVCGSLTNFFRVKLTSKDNLSYSSEPSYIGQVHSNNTKDTGSINTGLGPDDNEFKRIPKIKQNGADINAALDDLENMQKIEKTPILRIDKQVNSQNSKLDNLIMQADKAQSSLQHQNKQMRSFLR